jgi:hypothetical protein
MKRFVITLLIVALCLCGCSCSKTSETTEEPQENGRVVEIYNKDNGELIKKVYNEDAEYIVSVIENGEWAESIIMVICRYEFVFDGKRIGYAHGTGAFNDDLNYKGLVIEEEQRLAINEIIGIK